MYSLIHIAVRDIGLAFFSGCQHMVSLIYSHFSEPFTPFQAKLCMVPLLGTASNSVLKHTFHKQIL